MKADRPSRTAHFVAFGRATADAGVSHVPDFHDPTARVFLSDKGKRSLAKTERAAREGKRGIGLEVARAMAADWNDRFAQGRAKVQRGFYMRIAIART
jgi:O-methyltransferase involved in polyketide biosynthesis